MTAAAPVQAALPVPGPSPLRVAPASPDTRPHVAESEHPAAARRAGHHELWVVLDARALPLQRALVVGRSDDPLEREADRVADQVLQRACDCQGTCGGCGDEEQSPAVVRRAPVADSAAPAVAPPDVADVLASPGHGIPAGDRAFFEARLGRDFGSVRLHADDAAAISARAVAARAYTVGEHVVFGSGQYQAGSDSGRRLLAHELTHVLQQRTGLTGGGALRRSVVERAEPGGGEGPAVRGEAPGAAAPASPDVLSPQECPPPEDMPCPPATTSPSGVVNSFLFPHNSATLNQTQRDEIDATAAAWHYAFSSQTARVDGYASVEGPCDYNWNLSCRRAGAIRAELETPSDGTAGVPSGFVEMFAHGESMQAGPALAPNRNGTISLPVAPPVTPSPAPAPGAATCLPLLLGTGRGCGGGPDFDHHDYPPKTLSSQSFLALQVWAWSSASPSRHFVSNSACEIEMAGVLAGFAGAAGLAAFARFKAATGGTVTLDGTSTLGALALTSPSFKTTLAGVKAAIEIQLAAQAASGALDPCVLALSPAPQTHFRLGGPDDKALQGVIGGTQGESLHLTGFSGNAALRTYSADLRFLICDDFGVDENDLYFFGLFPFWVLQHERTPGMYEPFVNEFDLPVNISGTF
ncbi:MAG: eCIS core domain-containing protein [Acidimicrobiales bacterium]